MQRVVLLVVVGDADASGIKSELARLGYRVVEKRLPSTAIYWTPEYLVRNLSLDELGRQFEYVILPGTLHGDYCRYEPSIGTRIRKGARSLKLLEKIIALGGLSKLSCRVEAEKALPELMRRIVREALMEARSYPPKGVAFRLGGLSVPIRPPPILIASEVYACHEDTVPEAIRRSESGADIIILGADIRSKPDCFMRDLERLLDTLDKPVGVDPGRVDLMVKAVDAGVDLVLSLTPGTMDRVPRTHRGKAAYVIISEGRQDYSSLVDRAFRMGYERVIMDPLMYPPVHPGMLGSLLRAESMSKAVSVPMMLGLNNVVELIDADTTGTIALAMALAYEAGVSLVLIGEESSKARGNTLEARVAADLISASGILGVPPKDLGLSLLACKPKMLPNSVRVVSRGVVEIEANGYTRRVRCHWEELVHTLAELGDAAAEYAEWIVRACQPWLGLSMEC